MAKPSNHYVDNDKLVQEVMAYKARFALNPDERLPEYVGSAILEIARRFSMRPNFYGYSYRQEMVSDAVENCVKYIRNFDTDKSTACFAYLTQICFYAFLRRIAMEKKQSYIKHRLIQEMPTEALEQNHGDDAAVSQDFISYIQSSSNFDAANFEKSITKAPKKIKLTSLEEFMASVDALEPADE